MYDNQEVKLEEAVTSSSNAVMGDDGVKRKYC
jgi:hypothetical protein